MVSRLFCFIRFTSSVSLTGSYTEDEGISGDLAGMRKQKAGSSDVDKNESAKGLMNTNNNSASFARAFCILVHFFAFSFY